MTIPVATSVLVGLFAVANPGATPGPDDAKPQKPAAPACSVGRYTRRFDDAKPQKPIEPAATLAADQNTLAAANTDFALAYFNHVRSQPGNVIFSPLSISIAFSMVEAGAAGATAQQIRDAMHLQLPEPRLHPAFAAMLKQFNSIAASGKEGAPSLAIANSLWGVKGYPYQQQFLDTLKADYNATLTPTDFADPIKAAKLINTWVSDATAKKINDLIDPSALAGDTRLVLVNAVHFKGRWAEVFAAGSTTDEDFHLAADRAKKVPMMHQREHLGYFENDQLQAVSLGYSGSTLSMLIVLPRKVDGLADLEKSFDSKLLSEITGKIDSSKEVVLSMPRFKIDAKADLNDTLKAMGMVDAFDEGKANFTRMASHESLFISNAVHQAMIAVDEEGTEAAAATAIMMRPTAIQMPDEHPREFRADHPFLFMVRDSVTGSILFMGRVSEP